MDRAARQRGDGMHAPLPRFLFPPGPSIGGDKVAGGHPLNVGGYLDYCTRSEPRSPVLPPLRSA
jgi:hypothetical protein